MSDPAASWEQYEAQRAYMQLPGWTFARFGMRGSVHDDVVQWVTGAIRQSFGIFLSEFEVSFGSGLSTTILPTVVHLHSGLPLALFSNGTTAAIAAEVADASESWESLDPSSDEWSTVTARTLAAWTFHGVILSPHINAHRDGRLIPIFDRTAATVEAGKPQHLS